MGNFFIVNLFLSVYPVRVCYIIHQFIYPVVVSSVYQKCVIHQFVYPVRVSCPFILSVHPVRVYRLHGYNFCPCILFMYLVPAHCTYILSMYFVRVFYSCVLSMFSYPVRVFILHYPSISIVISVRESCPCTLFVYRAHVSCSSILYLYSGYANHQF